ncbi:MAG: PIN domain nuclease [Microbacterium sp.]|nr:PIN domain nuclease [Microbacterium sp.]
MILVDSSMWIDYFRAAPSPRRSRMEALIIGGGEVVLTEPVVMELLSGVRGSKELALVESVAERVPVVAIDPSQDFRAAAELARASRSNGHPIRSMVDCLIAAVAIRNGIPLLHDDRDYGYLAEVSPLRFA